MALAALFATLASALELLPALVVYGSALAVLASPAQLSRLPWLAGLALLGTIVRYLLLGGGLLLSHAVAFRVQRELRETLVDRLAAAPVDAREAIAPGDQKKTLAEDIDAIESLFAHNLPELTSAVVVPTLSLLVLLLVDWRLALASVVLVPPALALMSLSMRGVGERMVEWHAAEARANTSVLEYLRGMATLKAHHRDASSLARVRTAVLGIRDLAASMTRRTATAYQGFSSLLSSNLVVILPVGVWALQNEWIDVPQMVLFTLVGTGLTAPLLKLLFVFGTLQSHGVRLQRIERLLDLPAQKVDGIHSVPSKAAVLARQLTYAYDASRGPVLQDVHLEAWPGEVTAVVGPSGSGKSTLMALLSGEREPQSGNVLVAGTPLTTWSAAARSKLLHRVDQHTWLFSGTLADNIRLGSPEADDEAVEHAGELAVLREVAAKLDGGWQGHVGERGGTLSGGEAQRVAIARALLSASPVLLLDEVTAHLDPESEGAVQQALSRLAIDRTVIVIAHRLRTVQHAHRIVVLDGGRVVGTGRHAELLDQCPTYRRLWQAQEQARVWRLSAHAPAVEAP